MDFNEYLIKQSELHPSMQMQDIIKMCYQAVFGVEHMLTDIEKARLYFTAEYEATPADSSIPLYEPISDTFCRVNLAAWKARNLAPEELFRLFVASAKANLPGTGTDFNYYAETAESLVEDGLFSFSLAEWNSYFAAYKKDGIHPVHHSDAYRLAEHPAYRLVQKGLLPTDIG